MIIMIRAVASGAVTQQVSGPSDRLVFLPGPSGHVSQRGQFVVANRVRVLRGHMRAGLDVSAHGIPEPRIRGLSRFVRCADRDPRAESDRMNPADPVQAALPFRDDDRFVDKWAYSTMVMRWWIRAFCEHPMTQDWFVEAFERVADAGRRARLGIDTAVGALQEGCQARNAGRPIVDVVDELISAGGRETRLSAADAFREYERAIASMRAGVVRALVDEGGLALTDVAKRLKISRQAAARLYESGPDGDDGPG